MEEQSYKKSFTPKQALIKAQKYCAYQERCHTELNNKLFEWGQTQEDADNIICELIAENFLNEERFAKAYAGGKFRIKKWGRVKIKIELKRRQISDYCIKEAMKEIKDSDYFDTLDALVKRFNEDIKESNSFLKSQKVAKRIVSRGFEYNLVMDAIKGFE